MIIALIAIVATAIAVTLAYYDNFKKQVNLDLKYNAQILDETDFFQKIYSSAGGNKDNLDKELLGQLNDSKVRITWIAPDGTVLYDNDTSVDNLDNHLKRPEIQDAITYGSGESVRKSDTLNMSTYYYALRLSDNTILRVSTQAVTLTSIYLSALPIIALLAGIIFIVCILIGHLLTKSIMKPIERMAEQIGEDSREVKIVGDNVSHIELPSYKELVPIYDKIREQHDNILKAAKNRQDFTANVSHELKTPLTAISGYAELIENHMADPEAEVVMAQKIRKNAERLLSMINDTIKLSELDHNEITRTFHEMDLYDIVADTCDNLRVNAKDKNIDIEFKGEHVKFSADSDLIKELTDNLIQNAIRYNVEGGRVKVSVTLENKHPVLTVADTGIGIPKEQQDRIFERFYRVDKSRSRKTGGTGLGLSIVKHIADIHDANIVLSSEEGKGTEIRIEF